MLERVSHFGVRPLNLAADKAYGSGEFLAWLLERDIQPHIPVIDRRHPHAGKADTARGDQRDEENDADDLGQNPGVGEHGGGP